MRKIVYFTLVIFSLIGSFVQAQDKSVVRVGISYPNTSAYVFGTGEQLSGQQFQTDGIHTYKGYQYTVYYNSERNVCISRRKLPVGRWEEVVLPYKNAVDDAHNVIVMGICRNDGTIHLAYDHHNDNLHYSYSIAGSANDPANMPWLASSFAPTTNVLDSAVPDVTYPRFISKPDGNLLFECRFHYSGYGDSYLREYNASSKTWILIGRYVQGEDVTPDACAYINGMTYDKNGRMHVSWCWRDDFGGGSNHDFYYAYSDDHGRTWNNDKGTASATTDFMTPVVDKTTGNCLGQTKKSFMVEEIAYNRGYINQETQDVDSRGRIFAVNSHIPEGQGTDANWANSRTKSRLHLRYLKEDKTWVKKLITINGVSINSTRRVHLAFDSFDNAYVVANGVGVLMASPADDYTNWTLISDVAKTGYYSEPLVDRPLLKEKGILSFVYLSADKKISVFDYLTKNPNTPNGTGLLAEYFSDTDFKNLISSQVVATPNLSTIPANAKSIRWSGAFETLLGEEYSLYLHANGKTNVYVNDKLSKIIEAGTEATFKYNLIASHENNIVIETVGASPVTLSWSSINSVKSVIPSTSLYPVKSNDKPDALTPPPLPLKEELEHLYLGTKKNINSSGRDTIHVKPFEPALAYSLEVKTKINSVASGRGLDIEARVKTGKGFRFSLDKTSLNITSPLNVPIQFAAVDNSIEQVYRFAVKDDKVHVFRGVDFLGSANLMQVHDIQSNNSEVEAVPVKGSEVIPDWAGTSGVGGGKASDYGWDATGATPPWTVANGTSGVRYLDVKSNSSPIHLLNASPYEGRLLTLRWDGALTSVVYYYPVSLEANTAYDFSMVYEHWNNGAIGAPITVGISVDKSLGGVYESKTFATVEKNTLQNGNFKFTSKHAGTYYISFVGAAGTMYGVGGLSLKSYSYPSRVIVGKNYDGGAANMEVYHVSFQDGAYAPTNENTLPIEPILPKKTTLPISLQSEINLNAASGAKNIRVLDNFSPTENYTVEIAATVASAEGRGLDLEMRNANEVGLRTSLNTTSLNWIAPFSENWKLTTVDAGKQVIRYAVEGNTAHVYKNGDFLNSHSVTLIGSMNAAGTAEEYLAPSKPSNMYDGVNLIANPDFKNDAHNAAPAGWTSDKAMGGSPNPRVQEKSQTTELSVYPDGKKAFMFRFDASGGSYYAYPVSLNPATWHVFSFDLISWGANTGKELEVLVAKSVNGATDVLNSKTLSTPAIRATADRKYIRFRTSDGVGKENYYLIFKKKAEMGTTAITDLYLNENNASRLLFGKNYVDGAADIFVDYITVDYSGAFAPDKIFNGVEGSISENIQVYSKQNNLHVVSKNIIASIAIYDSLGRIHVKQKVQDYSVQLPLAKGIYVVQLSTASERIVKKIVLN